MLDAAPLPRTFAPLPRAYAPLPGAAAPLRGAADHLPGATAPLPGAAAPLRRASTPMPGAATPLRGVVTPLPGATTHLSEVDAPLRGAAPPLPGATAHLPGSPLTDAHNLEAGCLSLPIGGMNDFASSKILTSRSTPRVGINSCCSASKSERLRIHRSCPPLWTSFCGRGLDRAHTRPWRRRRRHHRNRI